MQGAEVLRFNIWLRIIEYGGSSVYRLYSYKQIPTNISFRLAIIEAKYSFTMV